MPALTCTRLARDARALEHLLRFFTVALAFMAVLSSAALAQPAVTVSPTSGPPTDNVTVSGSGFGADEAVEISFDTSDLAFGVTVSNGSFTGIRLAIPATATPGVHSISAVGTVSGTTAQTSFVVQTNWPQFHFGPAHLGYNATENVLNSANVGTMQVRWRAHTGTIAGSSPVVQNGIVYVGSTDHNFYAFNAATGHPLWKAVTGGEILSSPAASNGMVYVASGDYNLYAFDAVTGQPAWQTSLGGAGSTLAVANGVIYVESSVPSNGSDNYIHGLDAATGQLIWTAGNYGLDPERGMAPAVDDGYIFFTFYNDWLWQSELNGEGILALSITCTSSPAVASGVVYVGYGSSLAAIGPGFGILWTAGTSGTIVSSPAVANGVVYAGSDDNSLYAVDAVSGQVIWSAITGGAIASSPAVANGVVYVGSDDHNLYAFDAATGAPLRVLLTGGPVTSSPAVANGVVYVGSEDGYLYAFSLPPSND